MRRGSCCREVRCFGGVRGFLCGAGLLLEELVSEDVVFESSLIVFVYSLSNFCSLVDRVVGIGWLLALYFIGSLLSWMYVKGGGCESSFSSKLVMVSLSKSLLEKECWGREYSSLSIAGGEIGESPNHVRRLDCAAFQSVESMKLSTLSFMEKWL